MYRTLDQAIVELLLVAMALAMGVYFLIRMWRTVRNKR